MMINFIGLGLIVFYYIASFNIKLEKSKKIQVKITKQKEETLIAEHFTGLISRN